MPHGVERPAIAGDLADPARREHRARRRRHHRRRRKQQLVEFAVMGEAMARVIFGVTSEPSVGLLNVGVEEIKGLDEVKEAGALLREGRPADFRIYGFVEGDDLGRGTVDVVVTEGFTGNIALKTAEGTAKQIGSYLRSAMRSLLSRLGYLLARDAFRVVSRQGRSAQGQWRRVSGA
jgi:phosphate acyltransferase